MIVTISRRIRKVGLFGDDEDKPGEEHFLLAYRTARLLVQDGYIVVNGGGPGVMLAATLGAKNAHGKAEAVVIDEKIDMGENYEGQYHPNVDIVDTKIETTNYPDRLGKLIAESDAFMIFKGGTGTISEIGMVWSEAKFNFGKHKPIIFVGAFWNKILSDIAEELAIDSEETSVYEVVSSPEEAVDALKRAAR